MKAEYGIHNAPTPHAVERGARLAICVAAACFPLASAAAVKIVTLPPCVPTPRPISVDGRLGEWRGLESVKFVPITAFGQGELGAGRSDIAAVVRSCHDAEAVYLAVDWLSPLPPSNTTDPSDPTGWHVRGDGLELHILVGRTVSHVVSLPSRDGRTVSLHARRGARGAWRDLTAAGGAAGITVRRDGNGHSQEIRIPWAAITPKGAPPSSGKVHVMLDLAWRALPTEALAKLEQGIRVNCTHFTYNVLTARRKLFGCGYLPSPRDWGELRFAEEPKKAKQKRSPFGESTTVMTAGKAPRPLTIDGILSEGEWPKDAFAEGAYAPSFLGERFSCSLAVQFDDQRLYVAGRFSSPTPPTNTAAEVGRNGFKGGDCLQIRLGRDGKLVNLCGWLDANSGRPALTADGKDLARSFLLKEGAAEEFRIEEGKGYAMELSIPWRVLFPGTPPPREHEKMKATFQPWWIGTDPRFTLRGTLEIVSRGPLSIRYRMPRDAEVSLGVFDRGSRLLRWITRSDFRRAGPNTEYWDGRDQYGDPIAAGEYLLKALYHDPISTEYALSLGNPGTPPWPTADGRGDWLSDEANPQAAATDGEWVYLAAPGSEKGWAVIAVDKTGQRRWGVQQDFYPRSVALALQGDFLYALFSGPELTDTSGRYSGEDGGGFSGPVPFNRLGDAVRWLVRGHVTPHVRPDHEMKDLCLDLGLPELPDDLFDAVALPLGHFTPPRLIVVVTTTPPHYHK